MNDGAIVYVVDSDEAIGEALTVLLGTYDIKVHTFADVDSFLQIIQAEDLRQGCLLIDANSGIYLLRHLRSQGHCLPIVLLTSATDANIRQQAMRFGATDVLEKPLINAYLVERLTALLPAVGGLTKLGPRSVGLRDGTQLTIRLMRPEDSSIEQVFVRSLSAKARYSRFFSTIKELPPYLLERFTQPHYPQTCAVIATIHEDGRECIVAVARYEPTEQEGCAEFAVVVADRWQGFGIANRLLRGLITGAAIAGIDRLQGLVLRSNHRMLKLANELGFTASSDASDATLLRVEKNLHKSD